MTMRRVAGVFIADTARVLGEVTLGKGVNVWYGTVIRGDVAPVRIGELTNVQDNVVIHCDRGVPNEIGARVTIGHGAVVHGKSVGDGTLIGIGARVLDSSVIGAGCIIAAGAVVPPRLVVPDGMMVMGVPGRITRPITDEERRYLRFIPPHYAKLAALHADEPDAPTVRPFG